MPKTLTIVPTYDEIENIGRLVGRLHEEMPEADVLVVDDNSPDGTGRVVHELIRDDRHLFLLTRPGKAGLGQAYTAGFDWALKRGYDRILQMDADFSHDPAYAPILLKALDHHPVSMGTRYAEGGGTHGWGLFRRTLSRGGNFYARTVLGLPYHDLTGGFVAWKREVLERIDYDTVRSRGYAFQVEMKYRAHRAGFGIKEIPILFENRRFGTSKMSGRIIGEAALRILQLKRFTT